ncbi:MAG: ATP-binding cassette domain-containing protein, partial [Anaerolineales bacterium]
MTDLRLSTFDILSPTFDLRLLTMISANNLTKSFTSTPAVAGINLNVAPGEIYGLVGADGAGKTTTLRLLCGALRPDSGEVKVCGYDIATQTEQAREQIGYLSQRFSLYEDLTVLENIRFFAEVRGLKSTASSGSRSEATTTS